MKINKKIHPVLMLVVMLLGSRPVIAATLPSVDAFGSNTIAGYETMIQSGQVGSWQDVTFYVTQPNGNVLSVVANSGTDGFAKTSLSDSSTERAGTYSVRAALGTSTVASISTLPAHTFQVFADKVSSDKSSLMVDRTVAHLSNDAANLTVRLTDKFGNPVINHIVQVFSSRSGDVIAHTGSDGLTDSTGTLRFTVSSNVKGVSEYTVLDSTAGVMLSSKISVAFVDGSDFLTDVGGEFPFFIDTAKAAAGTLHHFDISGLPATIQSNQNVSFTVTAQDENNQSVQNYTGKIHFSAEGANGSNVTLPEDYTFKAEDLGTHQFALGLSFKASGNYKIVVTDLNNTLIKGTKDVTVGGSGGNPNNQQSGNTNITLDSPVAGTYSQKTQTISGKATPGNTVKIYDNQQEIGSVQASSDGKYSYLTSSLSDGQHSVYAVMFDGSQSAKGTSSTVLFAIDTTPPSVDDILLSPTSGIQPGSSINIKVTTEANLSQAAVVFNGDIVQLNPGLENPDVYVGTLQAPSTPGVYGLDILLVDQLSNEGSYKDKAKITVSNEGGSVETQETVIENTQQQTQQEQSQETQQNTQQDFTPITNTPPQKVSGMLSYPGNKKIVLVWDAATDSETFVKHYRVYYSNDPRNLNHYVDTKDASTTWYIPNLENGKEYYFAVSAFDSEEMESGALSEVVSGIPFTTEVASLPQVTDALVSNAHQSAPDIGNGPVHPGTGPEVLWLLFGSGAIGAVTRNFKKRSARIVKK